MADAAPVDAGSAPQPKAPAPDGELRIRGGVGGMSFQLEELLRGAGVLDQLVKQLIDVEDEALRVKDELEPFLPGSFATGRVALDSVAESRGKVGVVRQDLTDISGDIRASQRDYEAAEAKNTLPHMSAFDQLRFSGGPWFLPFGRNMSEEVVNTLIPEGKSAKDVIRDVSGSPFAPVGLLPRPVRAEKAGQEVQTIDPSMAASIRRVEEIHGRGNGEIEVVRLESSGVASWLVLIPGTEPEGENLGGSNPLDEAGVAEAIGYDSQYVVPAIAEALREAGAASGDPVVAVGHSQGGVHAMNLSQNKAFLAEFNLKFVLTAGSPTGEINPAPGVKSLHLEHVQDWVPAAEGVVNPDTKDRVTVTLMDPVSAPAGTDPGLGPGHAVEAYARGAELAAASNDPSLIASTSAFAGAVGAGGAATVTRFKLVREAMPERVHADPKPSVRESKSGAGTR